MSMMVSFVLSFFPRDVLDEILNLIESVSEDFLTTLTTVIFSPSVLRLLKKISYMLSSTDIATANYNLVNKNNIKQIFQR